MDLFLLFKESSDQTPFFLPLTKGKPARQTLQAFGYNESPYILIRYQFCFLAAISRSSIFMAESLTTVPGPKMATAPAS